MSYTLNIKAFFFNAKTDYLPYYKHFTLTLAHDATVVHMLEAIQSQNENFAYPKDNLVLKINQLVLDTSVTITDIVNKLGTTLQIDPVNSYRSNHGLIINDDDFMQSFTLLAPYTTEEDKTYYQTLYALHYASETSHYERHYIGDAILILAHKLISEGHQEKEAILKAITTASSGLHDCEYENNLFETHNYKEKIDALKAMVEIKNNTFSLQSLLHKFSKKKTKQPITQKKIDDLLEKNVAFYGKHVKTEQTVIRFSKENKLPGYTLLKSNPTLAFKKAATILLDAYDSGAEVLVVEDHHILSMFTEHFKTIENTIGRKMLGLELISLSDFVLQTQVKQA